MVKVDPDQVVKQSHDKALTWSVQKAIRSGPPDDAWTEAMRNISASVNELVGCENGNYVIRTCYEVLVKPRAAARQLLLTIGNEAGRTRWGVHVCPKDCFEDTDIADVQCMFGVAMYNLVMKDLVILCDQRSYQYGYRTIMWHLEYLHINEDEGDFESTRQLHSEIMKHASDIVKGEVGNMVVQHSLLMIQWEIASHAERDNGVWVSLRSDLLSLGLQLLQSIEGEDTTRWQCHFIARCIDILWYSTLLRDADLKEHRRTYVDCLLGNQENLLVRLSCDAPGRMVMLRGSQLCNSAELARLGKLCAKEKIKMNFQQATGPPSKFHDGLLHPDNYSMARLVL